MILPRSASIMVVSWFLFLVTTLPEINAQNFEKFEAEDGIILGAGIGIDILLRKFKKDFDFDNKPPSKMFLAYKAEESLSLRHKTASDIILRCSLAGDIVNIFPYDNFDRTWFLSLENFVITDVINLIAKKFIGNRRPFARNKNIPDRPIDVSCKKYDKLSLDADYSFYSGHTAHVAAFVMFTNTMLWHEGIEMTDDAWFWIATSLIPAITGFQRVKAGKHYPIDVAFGLGAGMVVGYLVPSLNSKLKSEQRVALRQGATLGLLSGLATELLFISLIKPGKHKPDCAGNNPLGKLQITPTVGFTNGIKFKWQL